MHSELKKLGFTSNMIVVYMFLVDTGRAKAGEIIAATMLQRSVVYGVLERLLERELISQTTQGGIKIFSANDPMHLVTEAESRRNTAEVLAKKLREHQLQAPREVLVYEGDDAIAKAVEKNLELDTGDTVYFLGPSKFGSQTNLEQYWRLYNKKRIKKGIKSKILYDRMTDKRTLDGGNELVDLEAKYMPFGLEMPVWFNIAGDQLSIVAPGEDTPLVFHLKSKAAADGMKKYFDYLWNQEVRTYIGWEEVEKLFLEELVGDLKKGDVEYVIGGGYGESEKDSRFDAMFQKHNGWLIKHGIEKRSLFYEKHRTRFESEIKKLGDPFFYLVKTRYMPDEFYSPIEIHVFADICVITYFGEQPISTVYTNKGIVDGFKKRFDLLWGISEE